MSVAWQAGVVPDDVAPRYAPALDDFGRHTRWTTDLGAVVYLVAGADIHDEVPLLAKDFRRIRSEA